MRIRIDRWFESASPEVQLEYLNWVTGSFDTVVSVGDLGRPASVTGVSTWSWSDPLGSISNNQSQHAF